MCVHLALNYFIMREADQLKHRRFISAVTCNITYYIHSIEICLIPRSPFISTGVLTDMHCSSGAVILRESQVLLC